MTGVRQERKRMYRKADDRLDDDEEEIEGDADDEGLVDVFQVDRMVVVAEAEAMIVVVVVPGAVRVVV
jgi:hypothetical protein